MTKRDIKQVDSAAKAVGLTPLQRKALGRLIHSEKPPGGADLKYGELVDMAQEIKDGKHGKAK